MSNATYASLGLALVVSAAIPYGESPKSCLRPTGPQQTHPVLPADGRNTEARKELPTEGERLHDLRVRKAERVWATYAPWSYDPALVEFFIDEHERVGLGRYWWRSWAYGMEAWGNRLRVEKSGAYGPMDQRYHNGFAKSCQDECRDLLPSGTAWTPDVLLEPRVNIRCHVEELAYWHRRTGRERWSLYRMVFYPKSPDGHIATNWGSRWPKWEKKIEEALECR